MPAVHKEKDVKLIQGIVQRKLNEKRSDFGFQLDVVDHVLDHDGWIHFVVSPRKKGVRAYDYAKALAEVELELRDENIEEVLLVPAMPD
jgi:hypothetical protein